MIDIVLTLWVILALLTTAANHYFHFYRNDKVRDFQIAMLGIISDTAKKRILMDCDDCFAPYDLFNKYSYDDMVYSFKPLTLEAWYTEEEIKVIKGEDLKEKKYEENQSL